VNEHGGVVNPAMLEVNTSGLSRWGDNK